MASAATPRPGRSTPASRSATSLTPALVPARLIYGRQVGAVVPPVEAARGGFIAGGLGVLAKHAIGERAVAVKPRPSRIVGDSLGGDGRQIGRVAAALAGQIVLRAEADDAVERLQPPRRNLEGAVEVPAGRRGVAVLQLHNTEADVQGRRLLLAGGGGLE